MSTRRTDRRTLYTIGVIKDAFLELKHDLPFEKISVKKLCEQAEISRATFYLHFSSIDEVLDAVLDDALLFSESASGTAIDLIDIIKSRPLSEICQNDAVLPACQRIADSDKYHDLFMDTGLSEYIIMRIYQHEKSRVVPDLMRRTNLSEEFAEMIFRFMLHGSFSVNKSLRWEKDEKWYQFQRLLSAFLDAGMSEVAKMEHR